MNLLNTHRGRLAQVIASFCIACTGWLWSAGTHHFANAGVGSHGTGRFYGEITDFASIFVNGVEFDISTANIIINGNPMQPESSLRRGMAVRIEGTINPGGTTGTATVVEYLGDIEGKVDAPATINGLNGTFTVHGVTVRTTERTQYETGTTLAGLLAGDIVEVSGFFNNADGSYTASRIEKRATFRKTELKAYISNVTATTFTLGNLTVNYASVPSHDIPSGGLSNGMYVEVKNSTAPPSGSNMTAERLSTENDVLGTKDDPLGYVQGITASTSGSSFRMGTLQVNFSGTTIFDGAPAAALADGKQVYAIGPVVGGVMNATAVTIPVAVTKVESVKMHGNGHECKIPMATDRDVSGEVETEPRNAGAGGHKLRFTFDGPVISTGNITSKGSNGTSDTGVVGAKVINGNTLEVPIDNVPDNRRAKITVENVNGYGRKISVSMGFLSGDSKRRGTIDDSTLNAVKVRGGQGVDDTNCAFDLNLTGTVSAADIAAIKARRQTVLAP